MADGAKGKDQATVTLDAATVRAAEERLGRIVETEVRQALSQEKHTMDAAQVQAALDAAKKEADAAKAEATQARKDVDAAKVSTEKLTNAVAELTKAMDAQAKAAQATDASRVKDKATKLAILRARGDKAKATDAVVTKLVALGEAAIDDQLELLMTPGIVAAPPARVVPDSAGNDSGIMKNVDGSYSVSNWEKFPKPANDPNSMGTRMVL